MNNDEHVVPSGGQHYSATNRVPNIHEYMEQLDRRKKDRDAQIDADLKGNKGTGEVKAHKNEPKTQPKDFRTVRDPVTGKDVSIRDTDMNAKEVVENPQVRYSASVLDLD